MSIVPSTRPKLEAEKVRAIGQAKGVTAKVYLVGIRGYYDRSLDNKSGNARGIYDDALFLVTPEGVYRYNANTDPSIQRKGIATLKPGVYNYRQDIHPKSRPGGYPALRPSTKGERLPVTRDGQTGDAWGIAINIHKGSRTRTSSEGCQTVWPDQWAEFIRKVYFFMDEHAQRTIPYVLITAEEMP